MNLHKSKKVLVLLGVGCLMAMFPVIPIHSLGSQTEERTLSETEKSVDLYSESVQIAEKPNKRYTDAIDLDIVAKYIPSKEAVLKIEDMSVQEGRTVQFGAEQNIYRREKRWQEHQDSTTTISLQPRVEGKRIENGVSYEIPNSWRSEFKSYMGYTAIHTVTSPQYRLVNSSDAYTNEYGLRMYKGRYCVAMGSGFTSKIGTPIDIVLKNGTVILCVLGDQKADHETDEQHMYHKDGDGSVVEFIVDYSVFNRVKDGSGTVNFVPGWGGKIEKVIVDK